jgi:hypothetical protein
MAEVVDVRQPGNQTLGGFVVGGTSATWNHNMGSVANPALVVGGAQDAGANSTSCRWDDAASQQAFTLAGTVTQGATRGELWGLTRVTPIGNKAIRVSWSGSHDGGFSSASYAGVNQASMWDAAAQTATGASGSNPSLTVNTVDGHYVVDAVVQDFSASSTTSPAKGASQNYLGAGRPSDPTIGVGSSDRLATGSTAAMTWTVDTTKGAWGQVGRSLAPAVDVIFPQAGLFHPGTQPGRFRFYVKSQQYASATVTGPQLFLQDLTATLSFTGGLTKRTATIRTAALSFSGTVIKRTTPSAFLGALSFTGAIVKRTGKSLTGGLSFVGSVTRFVSHLMTGGLSFTGSLTKLTLKQAFTAALSFTGSFLASSLRFLSFTAGLSFSGAMSKQTNKTLTGTLSFSGTVSKFVSHLLTGTLSFAGNIAKQTAHGMSAGLSFTGSLAKSTRKAFTAALDFVGSLATALAHGGGTLFTIAFTAGLSFTGQVGKLTKKRFTGSLGMSGTGIGSDVILIGFRLAKRIKGIIYEWLD